MTDYRPVGCARYDILEAAILRHLSVRARWQDAAGEDHGGIITRADLQTRRGAEYLIARDADVSSLRLRLDRVQTFWPVA